MSLWRKPGVAIRTALTSSRFRAWAISETATADGIASTAFFPREISASTTTETSAPSIRFVRRLMWSVPILPAPTTHTRRFVELDSDFILSYKITFAVSEVECGCVGVRNSVEFCGSALLSAQPVEVDNDDDEHAGDKS